MIIQLTDCIVELPQSTLPLDLVVRKIENREALAFCIASDTAVCQVERMYNLICRVTSDEFNSFADGTFPYKVVVNVDMLRSIVDSCVVSQILGTIVVHFDRNNLWRGLDFEIFNTAGEPYSFFCGETACDVFGFAG